MLFVRQLDNDWWDWWNSSIFMWCNSNNFFLISFPTIGESDIRNSEKSFENTLIILIGNSFFRSTLNSKLFNNELIAGGKTVTDETLLQNLVGD